MSTKAELERLAAVGAKFSGQWRGRRPGPLSVCIDDAVARLEKRTFAALLIELRFQAMCRGVGRAGSPIVAVDRKTQTVTYIGKDGRERTVSFKRVANRARLRTPREK